MVHFAGPGQLMMQSNTYSFHTVFSRLCKMTQIILFNTKKNDYLQSGNKAMTPAMPIWAVTGTCFNINLAAIAGYTNDNKHDKSPCLNEYIL